MRLKPAISSRMAPASPAPALWHFGLHWASPSDKQGPATLLAGRTWSHLALLSSLGLAMLERQTAAKRDNPPVPLCNTSPGLLSWVYFQPLRFWFLHLDVLLCRTARRTKSFSAKAQSPPQPHWLLHHVIAPPMLLSLCSRERCSPAAFLFYILWVSIYPLKRFF